MRTSYQIRHDPAAYATIQSVERRLTGYMFAGSFKPRSTKKASCLEAQGPGVQWMIRRRFLVGACLQKRWIRIFVNGLADGNADGDGDGMRGCGGDEKLRQVLIRQRLSSIFTRMAIPSTFIDLPWNFHTSGTHLELCYHNNKRPSTCCPCYMVEDYAIQVTLGQR